MPLTTAQQVRFRIQDRLRLSEEIRYGDGSGSAFKLQQGAPFSTLISASAFVMITAPTPGWSATGATFDNDLGQVSFGGVISAYSAWRATYLWSVFSEDEIAYLTAVGGSVAGAALEAVKVLMFDSLKRARWSAPDGTSYDDTSAQAQLQKMYDQLWQELREGPAGGIESWGEQQQYFSSEYNG